MQIPYSVINQIKYAIYLPAIQPQYARGVIKPKALRQLPKKAKLDDLNFFKPNSTFFNLDAALYSAGLISNHNTPPPCMVSQRARGKDQTSLIIGDSGGYQVATQGLNITPQKREDIYNWLIKTCDLAVTLDVPTFPMYAKKSPKYTTFKQCLHDTMGHLAAFKAFGGEQQYFLNVLQGDGLHDCDIWYDTVKHYDFYGWAIAGSQKKTIQHLLWRLLAMIEDGKFNRDETWIHFLGVGDMKTAVLLTTIRDVLRYKFPKCAIEISFDTSSPFFLAGTKLMAMDAPQLNPSTMRIPTHKIDKKAWAMSRAKFPFQGSEVSNYLKKGDIIRTDWQGINNPDELGYLLLQNHNVEVQVSSIDAVHKVLASGLPRYHLEQILPYHLLEGIDAVKDVLLQKTVSAARSKLLERNTVRYLNNSRHKV